MPIESLAPELIIQILQATECPHDLWSTVSAIPKCLHIFNTSPGHTLGHILRRVIEPEAFPHALAILDVRHSPKGDENDEGDLAAIGNVDDFAKDYFQSVSHQPPLELMSMKQLMALRRLYIFVSTFTDDYFTRAMDAFGFLGPRDLQMPQPRPEDLQILPYLMPLTRLERARLQRAFFRYEIYSRLFPVDPECHGGSLLPAESQFNRFLSRMRPWEVEELSCVHHYMTIVIGDCMDRLEDQVVKAVRDAEIAIRHDHPRSDLVRFDSFALPDMALFSVSGRIRSPNSVSYLASLGLSFSYKLIKSDESGRKDMIRANTPSWRDFLPEALEHAPANAPRTVTPAWSTNEYDDDDVSEANDGYWYFKRSPQDVFLKIHAHGVLNKALRERGYVFWDKPRIRGQLVHDGLRAARDMDEEEVNRSNRYSGLSVEERLKGMLIPRGQMERINAEFGSTLGNR
ncbi:Fc.00g107780.m01.CDS01 [Cosmosporella sp. VM-42]